MARLDQYLQDFVSQNQTGQSGGYSYQTGSDRVSRYFREFLGQETEDDIKKRKEEEEERRKAEERERARQEIQSRNEEAERKAREKTSITGQIKHLFSKEGAQARKQAITNAQETVPKAVKSFVDEATKPTREFAGGLYKALDATAELRREKADRIERELNIDKTIEEAQSMLGADEIMSEEALDNARKLKQSKAEFNQNILKKIEAASQAGNTEALNRLNNAFKLVNGLALPEEKRKYSEEDLDQIVDTIKKNAPAAIVDIVTVGRGSALLKAGSKIGLKTGLTEIAKNISKKELATDAALGAAQDIARNYADDQQLVSASTPISALAGSALGVGFEGAGQALGAQLSKYFVSKAAKQAAQVSQKAFNEEVSSSVAGQIAVNRLAKEVNNGIAVQIPEETLKVFNDEVTQLMGRDFANSAQARLAGIEEIIKNPASRIQMPKTTELVKEIGNIPTPDYKELMKKKYSLLLDDNQLQKFKDTGTLPQGTGLLPPNATPNYSDLSRQGKKHLVVLDGIEIDNSDSLVPTLKLDANGGNVEDFRLNWVDEAVEQAETARLAQEAELNFNSLVESIDKGRPVNTAEGDFGSMSIKNLNTLNDTLEKRLAKATDEAEVNNLSRLQEQVDSELSIRNEGRASAQADVEAKRMEYEAGVEAKEAFLASSGISKNVFAKIKRAIANADKHGVDLEAKATIGTGANRVDLDDIATRAGIDTAQLIDAVRKIPSDKELLSLKPTREDIALTRDTFVPKPDEVSGKSGQLDTPLAQEARKYKSAEEFVNNQNKLTQLDEINKLNPMTDEYHTGIRSVKDIKTFRETFNDPESFVYPDFSKEMARKALKDGEVIIYSSKPLDKNTAQFVTPSRMMAADYAGNGKVYSKTVNIDDVAWISGDEGQLVGNTKSKLTDIWNTANKKVEMQKSATKPVEIDQFKADVQGTVKPKKPVSSLATRLNEDLPDGFKMDDTYDPITIKNELDEAAKELGEDSAKAIKKALDPKTSPTKRAAILAEVADRAKQTGDLDALQAVSTKLRVLGTETGQALNMFKAYGKMNPETEYMESVVKSRLSKLNVDKKSLNALRKELYDKTRKEVNQAVSKSFTIKDANKLIDDLMC